VEKGVTLQSHEDIPDNFREELYMEERHRLESQQSKNNKMVGTPGSCHPINMYFWDATFPTIRGVQTNRCLSNTSATK
jgi:hypothetical protein